MGDDEIREVHGGTMKAGLGQCPTILFEHDDRIIIREGYADCFSLTAHDARWLARKLNRLALRIEKRATETER
jgi:hypothetical protein